MQMPLLPDFALLTVLAITAGCSAYDESQADDMILRQMDAMVFVEGGEFMMGNPGGWDGSRDSWPPHKVILDDFYIQKYEVTQGDFELFQAVTGYSSSDDRYEERKGQKPEHFSPDLPAIASWKDASEFCHWLGQKTNESIVLPTEAQWEYAARAKGKMLHYATKDGKAQAGVTIAAGPTPHARGERGYQDVLPHPPGSFPPNEIGLYDMSGNMGEWVRDYYRADYYQNSPTHNPLVVSGVKKDPLIKQYYRVRRGGNFQNFVGNTTVSRRKSPELVASITIGFRCTATRPFRGN